MRTRRRVDALRRQAQPGDRLAGHDVAIDDFVDIGFGHAAVPHAIRVDDDRGAMLTLVETPGAIGADAPVQSSGGQSLLECLLQPVFGIGVAAAARMTGLSLVAADEDVLFERCHGVTSRTGRAQLVFRDLIPSCRCQFRPPAKTAPSFRILPEQGPEISGNVIMGKLCSQSLRGLVEGTGLRC